MFDDDDNIDFCWSLYYLGTLHNFHQNYKEALDYFFVLLQTLSVLEKKEIPETLLLIKNEIMILRIKTYDYIACCKY